MAEQRLMLAVGRIERALSKLEQAGFGGGGSTEIAELSARHRKLKDAAEAALADIDAILAQKESANG
jgi:hypothetical protein